MGSYIFYPDADPETSSVDGYINSNQVDGTWNNVHSIGNNTATAPLYVRLDSGSANNTYNAISRSSILYDTSSIPPTEVPISGTISLWGNSKATSFVGGANFLYNIVSSNPASDTALSVSDFNSFGTTYFSSAKTYGEINIGSYNTWSLNGDGMSAINTDGVSKFGIREQSYDINNVPAPWEASKQMIVIFNAAESAAGTTNDPRLTVTTETNLGLKINIGDTWKNAASMKINIGDVWKEVIGIWINIGDVWKLVM